jgi:hypothetical protein
MVLCARGAVGGLQVRPSPLVELAVVQVRYAHADVGVCLYCVSMITNKLECRKRKTPGMEGGDVLKSGSYGGHSPRRWKRSTFL